MQFNLHLSNAAQLLNAGCAGQNLIESYTVSRHGFGLEINMANYASFYIYRLIETKYFEAKLRFWSASNIGYMAVLEVTENICREEPVAVEKLTQKLHRLRSTQLATHMPLYL